METKLGGWTPYVTPIPAEDLEVFKKALQGLVGVNYAPLAVAKQLVSGMNYRFFCNAQAVYPGAANEAAIVQIYKPLTGDPHITSITRV
ncbi:MAG: hypothetical protein H6Q17_648 [Bacteroidetes bacterium]|nr:hypothetical protein [Bacteroidota bacterium]